MNIPEDVYKKILEFIKLKPLLERAVKKLDEWKVKNAR